MNPFSRPLCQQVNLPSLPARFNPANAKCHSGAHLHQLPAWSFAITKPSQQSGSGQTDVGQCHGALIDPSWSRSGRSHIHLDSAQLPSVQSFNSLLYIDHSQE